MTVGEREDKSFVVGLLAGQQMKMLLFGTFQWMILARSLLDGVHFPLVLLIFVSDELCGSKIKIVPSISRNPTSRVDGWSNVFEQGVKSGSRCCGKRNLGYAPTKHRN